MKTRVIGLLGGTGSGKSTAARWLHRKGASVIDADEVSKDLMRKGEPGYDAVVGEFGPEILSEDGSIDRRSLGRVVFADAVQRQRLERVIHPLMAARIAEQIAASRTPITILDCAVLLRPAFRRLADEVWVVEAPAKLRAERIMQRDGLTGEEAADRLSAQNTQHEMHEAADRIIVNSGTADDLYAELQSILESEQR